MCRHPIQIMHTLYWVIHDKVNLVYCISVWSVFGFAHDAYYYRCCVCNVFFVRLPLAIGAESYAQMLVIFNKFYNDIIKIMLSICISLNNCFMLSTLKHLFFTCRLLWEIATFQKVVTYEPKHVISNNVAFWQVLTQTRLCSLLLILETPNGVQSEA